MGFPTYFIGMNDTRNIAMETSRSKEYRQDNVNIVTISKKKGRKSAIFHNIMKLK